MPIGLGDGIHAGLLCHLLFSVAQTEAEDHDRRRSNSERLPWTLPFVSTLQRLGGRHGLDVAHRIDQAKIAPMSCMMPHVFDKLFASTIFPLVLAAIILVVGKISRAAPHQPYQRVAMDLRA